MTRRRHRAAAAIIGLLATALAATAVTGAATPVASAPASQDELFAPRLVTVDTPTRAAKQRLQALGLDLTEHAGHDYAEVVLHTPADLLALTGAGLTYDVRIPDLVARGLEIAEIDEAYAAEVTRSKLPSGRTGYRFYDDYVADLAGLRKKHPSLVRTFTLKRPTLDGRKVHAVEIGSDIGYRNPARPTFLLMGAHHAREWPSAELAMEFAIDLAESYGRNRRITGLLDRARVIVVPVVNVDGFTFSRQDGEYVDLRELDGGGTASILGTPGRAYMRKNCRIVDGRTLPAGACSALLATPGAYGPGVDLNRNYGGFWGGPGASEVPLDPTYRGAEAFSEPETQNIRDLIRGEQATMLISNHTFGDLVLRPNGVNPQTVGPDGEPVGDAPDERALQALGARMTAQNGYQNIHGWELYDTTGTTEDYSYNATGGFGYTFEIGPDEFHPPFADVVGQYRGTGRYAGRGNRGAYLEALEHAVDVRYSGRLVGEAPRGAVVRLAKTFRSPTWESSFADFVNTSFTAAGSGSFSWIVNPSTRPVAARAGRREAYTLTCERPNGTVLQTMKVYLDRGQRKVVDLAPCRRRY